MTLYEMVCCAEVGRKIHICIHDVSGALSAEKLKLDFSHKSHSCAFCDMAKETAQGYLKCVEHKERVNRIAAKKRTPFFGMCPYGIWEIAYPVKNEGKTICIIYLGNILENKGREDTAKKVLSTAKLTGCNTQQLLKELDNCQKGECEDFIPVARMLADFIIANVPKKHENNEHWAVKEAKDYVNQYYSKPLLISSVSSIYNLNPRYFGRIFKEQERIEFNNYVNRIRIQKSKEFLRKENITVSEAALLCGYDDFAYFSRVFKKNCGVSSRQYKKGAF